MDMVTRLWRGTAPELSGERFVSVAERTTEECWREGLSTVTAETVRVSLTFNILNLINKFKLQLFQVWETLGTCNANKGQAGTVRQVLQLEGEERERSTECFNAQENGWCDNFYQVVTDSIISCSFIRRYPNNWT